MTEQEQAVMEEAQIIKTRDKKALLAIQLLYDIQSKEIVNSYNRGLVNGLALAISILTGEPPKYITKEDEDYASMC